MYSIVVYNADPPIIYALRLTGCRRHQGQGNTLDIVKHRYQEFKGQWVLLIFCKMHSRRLTLPTQRNLLQRAVSKKLFRYQVNDLYFTDLTFRTLERADCNGEPCPFCAWIPRVKPEFSNFNEPLYFIHPPTIVVHVFIVLRAAVNVVVWWSFGNWSRESFKEKQWALPWQFNDKHEAEAEQRFHVILLHRYVTLIERKNY